MAIISEKPENCSPINAIPKPSVMSSKAEAPIGECTSQATCDAVIMDVGGKSTALFKEAGKESDRRPVFREYYNEVLIYIDNR